MSTAFASAAARVTGGLAWALPWTPDDAFAAGFGFAVVVGALLGVWIATSFRVRAIADMFIAMLYPLPKVTLIPLLVMAVAFSLLFLTLHLAAMRNEILRRRVRALQMMQASQRSA